MADDRTTDLLRMTIERELERLKTEVANAKVEFEAVKGSLAQQVADAKVQIGDQAIEKMNKVFSEFRLWAALCLVLFGTVVGFTGYQLYSVGRQIIETKITDWLSFDKKGALLKDSLEGIRMRVVLDGLVTKMMRSGLGPGYGRSIELTTAEKSRLVNYMLDPNCSETDFRDGARVLGAYVGLFYRGVDTNIDELLSKTMTRFQVDNDRPLILLESLKRYGGIAPYADGILKDAKIPDYLREAAFNALAVVANDDAREYAAVHLLTERYAPLQEAEARELAARVDALAEVDQWVAKKTAQGEGIGVRVMLADELAPGSSSMASFDTARQKWQTDRTASLLMDAISMGAKLNFDDRFPPRADLGFRTDGSAGFRQPERLFEDSKMLMDAMIAKASTAHLSADTFVRALTTKGSHGEIFGVSAVLGRASILGETYGPIDTDSVAGPVLLVANDKVSPSVIEVSFRAKDGRWVTDHVKSFNDFYAATVHFAYDPTVLQLARSHNLNDLDGLSD